MTLHGLVIGFRNDEIRMSRWQCYTGDGMSVYWSGVDGTVVVVVVR